MFGGPIGSWAFTPPRHGLRFLAPAPGPRCAGRAAGAPTGLGARGFLAAAVVPWSTVAGNKWIEPLGTSKACGKSSFIVDLPIENDDFP